MAILLGFFIAWGVLIFSLKVVEVLTDGTLSRALLKRNITLKFGYFSFHTTRFNSRIERIAQKHRRFCLPWFDAGSLLGFVGLLASLVILFFNISHTLPTRPPLPVPTLYPRPRIPFYKFPPRFMPSFFIKLLSESDHNPAGLIIPPDYSDMHELADMYQIDAFNIRGPTNSHNRPPRPHSPPGLSGGCDHRRAHYFGKVGRFMDASGWPGHARRRRPFRRHHFDQRRTRRRYRRMRHRFPYRRGYRPYRNGFEPPPLVPAPFDRVSNDDELKPDQIADMNIQNGIRPPTRRLLFVALDHDTSHVGNKSSETPSTKPHTPRRFLTPLVPGVTVPVGDVWYMLAAVLLAGLVHELGHGIAAAAQDSEVASVGAFIALLLPGAFVQFTSVEDLSPRAQLRVYCAGAWHNFISAIVALVAINFLALISFPLYSTGIGALVVAVPPVSPLSGSVQVADVVLGIGGHSVTDGRDSFRTAVNRLIRTGDSVGFCVSDAAVSKLLSNSSEECCSSTYDGNDGRQCFRKQGLQRQHTCIDPDVISSTYTCRLSMDCSKLGDDERKHLSLMASRTLSKGSENNPNVNTSITSVGCYVPVLPTGIQLVDVRVRSARSGQVIHYFFEGPAHILGQSMKLSSFVPRVWTSLPWGLLQVLSSLDTPNLMERFLQYLASISLGLAIVNMAPVIALDGQASSEQFVRVIMPHLSLKKVKRIRAGTVIVGSILLLVNILLGLMSIESMT